MRCPKCGNDTLYTRCVACDYGSETKHPSRGIKCARCGETPEGIVYYCDKCLDGIKPPSPSCAEKDAVIKVLAEWCAKHQFGNLTVDQLIECAKEEARLRAKGKEEKA